MRLAEIAYWFGIIIGAWGGWMLRGDIDRFRAATEGEK